MGRQPGKDLSQLGRRLAWRKNHLRHAHPQGAMMVDLREAQVLKWQVPEPLDGMVRREFAAAY